MHYRLYCSNPNKNHGATHSNHAAGIKILLQDKPPQALAHRQSAWVDKQHHRSLCNRPSKSESLSSDKLPSRDGLAA